MLGRIKNKPTLRNTVGNLQKIMDKEKNHKKPLEERVIILKE